MRVRPPKPESWLEVRPEGLYCRPGDFYIDPHRPVERAVVTHGHADHARPNNQKVLATTETLAIMKARYRAAAGQDMQALGYGQSLDLNGVDLTFLPAGHVLGSAQVVLEWKGSRCIVSGDYKRRPDPTCAAFEVMPCDVYITEATFGLPVFRHPDDRQEIEKLIKTLQIFPERTLLVGAYALGKAQRVISLLRLAGYDAPIYLHGALIALCELYEDLGVPLGELIPAAGRDPKEMVGQIVMAPPSALADRWSRRLVDPLTAMASGWMRVRQRAKQRGVELPLILSDHADWDELTQTLSEVDPGELWVTHGNEEALVHYAISNGWAARALSLIGRGEEEQEEALPDGEAG